MLHPKKILIIALRQIGDTLITTPLIDDVAFTWPDAEIHFLCFESSKGILAGNPHIHTFICSSVRPKRAEYAALIKQVFWKYDMAIVTQPNDRSHLFGLLSAPVRFGVVPNDAKQGWWKRMTCQHTVEVDYLNQHVITEKRKLIPEPLRRLHYPVSVTPPESLPLPESLLNGMGRHPEKYIVIHATPLGNYKRIDPQTWVNVILFLLKKNKIFLTGSHAASDQQLNSELLLSVPENQRNKVIDTSGQLSFGQLSTLLKGAALYIGVDTSISHLAAACNTPSIVLFGPTPPTNFGPWPNGFKEPQPFRLKALEQTVGPVTILQGPGDCVPCRKAGCDDSTVGVSQCLLNLDEVSILRLAEIKLGSKLIESAEATLNTASNLI
jgi:heptosyltransferase-3